MQCSSVNNYFTIIDIVTLNTRCFEAFFLLEQAQFLTKSHTIILHILHNLRLIKNIIKA